MAAAVGAPPAEDVRLISQEDHARFASIVREHTGIKLGENKRQLLSSRLQKRMRVHGLQTFGAYWDYLNEHLDTELGEFINAITTNLTSFFRENHHFEFLRRYFDEVPSGSTVRIWSAGCSTGEEPYSIGIVYQESGAAARRVALKVTATDIDSQCVAVAERGVYGAESTRAIGQSRMAAHFLRGTGSNEGKVRVRPQVRELIQFRRLNLLDTWPFDDPFDIVFCRNVVIYFDDDVQRTLFDRFAGVVKPGGHIVIGHSENLQRVCGRFRNLGQTIYAKVK
jgi:chemotaxis protein methyltransferase CheR